MYKVVIEVYVVLSVINAFLGVGQGIYQDAFPSQSIRSPFTSFPLGSEFPELNTTGLILNMTNPTNSTGGIIEWVQEFASDFTAIIDVILDFVKFFTAGYIVDLLIGGIGFPAFLLQIVLIPVGIYLAYMTFVMITNRLGN